jgi:hypothetical protein
VMPHDAGGGGHRVAVMGWRSWGCGHGWRYGAAVTGRR